MESFFELLGNIPNTIYNRDWSEDHKPDIVKLFGLYSAMFDRLKEVIDDLAALKNLTTQTGDILDEIGKIVKEPRSGKSDDVYRNFLYIAIQRNISNGSLRKIADITKLIIKDNQDADYTLSEEFPITLLDSFEPDDVERRLDSTWILNPYQQQPAEFTLDVTGIPPELGEYLAAAISEIKAAGVKATVTVPE